MKPGCVDTKPFCWERDKRTHGVYKGKTFYWHPKANVFAQQWCDNWQYCPWCGKKAVEVKDGK
jgi:hypothetical protein